MRVRKIFIMAVFILLFIGFVNAQPIPKEVPAEYGYVVKLGQTMPDFDLVLPDGSASNTKDLRGKVVMLQFTASWCGVYRKEMPHIESEIWLKYKDNPDFSLYGIDLKEPAATVTRFRQQVGITYPIALDPEGEIFYNFAAPGAGVTRNVIIDRTGRIAFLTRLYKEEEFKQMKDVIGQLLDNASIQ